MTRTEDDARWRVKMTVDGEEKAEEFDKVVFCHGYQTKANMPNFEGKDLFKGPLMHAQQFRRLVKRYSDVNVY